MAANYAATATTSQRPHLNSTRSSSDGVVRTKILLLGLRRSVSCLFCRAVDSVPQSWENIHPAVSLQQHDAQSNVLSRDNNAHHEARYRVCSVALLSSLPPDGKVTPSTIIPLEIWDCPANTTVESLGVPLAQFSTIIFVIDIRVCVFILCAGMPARNLHRICTTNPFPSSWSSSSRRTMRIRRSFSRFLCTKLRSCRRTTRLVCCDSCPIFLYIHCHRQRTSGRYTNGCLIVCSTCPKSMNKCSSIST